MTVTEDFLSLSLVEKSKPTKRSIVAEDSIHLAKEQKRCKLKGNMRRQNKNFNDESCDEIVDSVVDVCVENVVDHLTEAFVENAVESFFESEVERFVDSVVDICFENVVDHLVDDFVEDAVERFFESEVERFVESEVDDNANILLSEEIEFVGGGLDLDFSEISEEENSAPDSNCGSKKGRKRGPNKVYVLVEDFEEKTEFDHYWKEIEFYNVYYHHVFKSTEKGMEEIFRCKNASKRGFQNC